MSHKETTNLAPTNGKNNKSKLILFHCKIAEGRLSEKISLVTKENREKPPIFAQSLLL